MITIQDEKFMRRCFHLARLGSNKTKTNPNVGAVIVFKDKVIGEGYHSGFGMPHAEVEAIESVPPHDKELLPQSTMYISLEPCNHTGKTPPCTSAILANRIPKVRVSCLDPNEQMHGKSISYLKKKNVDVLSGILEEEGKALIRPFIVHQIAKRPYIILKFAQSRDGYIGKEGQSIWLSGKYSQVLVHKWRSEIDGILIGSRTLNTDNPALTTRLYSGNSPVRIILDLNGSGNRDATVYKDKFRTWTFTQKSNNMIRDYTKRIIKLAKDRIILDQLLEYLFEHEIFILMVEGGRYTINAFIQRELWDEARILRTKKIIGDGIKAPVIAGDLTRKMVIGSDEILWVRNKNPCLETGDRLQNR